MASPSAGMDRPFSPSWADAEQAGLDRVRRDAAMAWLIENNLLEREDEAENQRSKGRTFRITITFTARCSESLILGGAAGADFGGTKAAISAASDGRGATG